MAYEYSYYSNNLDSYNHDDCMKIVETNYYSFDGVFEEYYKLELEVVIQYIKENRKYYSLIITEDNHYWYIQLAYHNNEMILPKNGRFNLQFQYNDKVSEHFLIECLKKFKHIPGFNIVTFDS